MRFEATRRYMQVKEVKEFGNGAHVTVPKAWEGTEVEIRVLDEDEIDEVGPCPVCGATKNSEGEPLQNLGVHIANSHPDYRED